MNDKTEKLYCQYIKHTIYSKIRILIVKCRSSSLRETASEFYSGAGMQGFDRFS